MLQLLLLFACSEPDPVDTTPVDTTDSGGTEQQTFERELVLGDYDVGKPCSGSPLTWLVTPTYFSFVAVAPGVVPSSPYELRSVKVLATNGVGAAERACDSTIRARVVVWTQAEITPTHLTAGESGWPEPQIVAETTIEGLGIGETEDLIGLFDPPVLVESTERLWVGIEEDELSATGAVFCASGCGGLQTHHYYSDVNVWGADPGWATPLVSPYVELTVGH